MSHILPYEIFILECVLGIRNDLQWPAHEQVSVLSIPQALVPIQHKAGGGGVESLEALGGTRAKNLDPMGARQATPSRCATCFYLIELRLNT